MKDKRVMNMAGFLTDKSERNDALEKLSPGQVLTIIQAFRTDRKAVETIIGYARRFKQASPELTVEDVMEVRDLTTVKSVMES